MGSGPSAEEVAAQERQEREEREARERREREAAEREAKEKAEHARRQAEYEAKKADRAQWEKLFEATKTELKTESTELAALQGEANAAEAELKNQEEKVKEQKTQIEDKLQKFEKDVAAAQLKWDENNGKIRDAINKMNVDEGSIPQFLNLINDGLLIGTLNNTAKREELNAKIGAFGELISRKTDFSMAIDSFFKGKLAPFVKYLKDEEYEEMDDILCDDKDEFGEIVEVITEAIQDDDDQKDKYEKFLEGKGKAYRDLNKLCLRKKAEAKGGWIPSQDNKKRIVKKQLAEVSPPLANFFGVIDEAVNDARMYLEYGGDAKNPLQQNVLDDKKLQAANEKKLEAIKLIVESDEKEKEAVKGQAKDAQAPLTVKETKVDKGLKADDASKIQVARQQNNALMTAAVVKLHIVESLASTFDGGPYPATKKSGLTLAKEVENCSVEIMRSQATIRGSIIVARQLIEFKPAKPGDKAKEFWGVIDKGIINIFNNYIEMSKVAATYFAFFVKFKSGFEHFNSCYEIDGEKVDLLVATEYIQRDVKEFGVFKAKMQEVVDKLTKEAKEVISDCVKQTAGAENFLQAQKAKDEAEVELSKAREELHKQQNELRKVYDAIYAGKIKAIREDGRLKTEVKQKENKVQRLKDDRDLFNKKMTDIKL